MFYLVSSESEQTLVIIYLCRPASPCPYKAIREEHSFASSSPTFPSRLSSMAKPFSPAISTPKFYEIWWIGMPLLSRCEFHCTFDIGAYIIVTRNTLINTVCSIVHTG